MVLTPIGNETVREIESETCTVARLANFLPEWVVISRSRVAEYDLVAAVEFDAR